jgi:hypothetical protein
VDRRTSEIVSPDVRAALTERLATLDPRPWRVRVAFTDAPPIVVDCRERTIRDDGAAESIECTIEISHDDFLRIMSGELNPRYAMLYSHATVEGSATIATQFGDWLAGKHYTKNFATLAPSLPQPTADLADAWTDLEKCGYAIVEDALDARRLEVVRTRVVEQAAAEAEAGIACFEGSGTGKQPPNQRLWSLINKGSVFMELLDHPLVDEFALRSVGENFRLGSYFCLIAGPGGNEGGLHYDQMSLVPPIPNVNIGLNIVLFLDEFTAANGATRVLPCSHLPDNRIAPDHVFTQDGAVAAEGPAGSALIFDSRLWHGTGPNRTDGKRHGLFMFFVRYWMRPNENPYLSTHPSVIERMSDRVKTMYGLRHVSSLGRVGPTRNGDIVRYAPEELVMEMRPLVRRVSSPDPRR